MFLDFPHYSGTFGKFANLQFANIFADFTNFFFLRLLFSVRQCPHCVTNGQWWIRHCCCRELHIYDVRWLASFITFLMKVLEFCISMEASIFKNVSVALLQLWCAIYNLCYVH